jgi:hypothetical protein
MPMAGKNPFFRLPSLNFSSNIPDFDCKIWPRQPKKWKFFSLKALYRIKSNTARFAEDSIFAP